MSWADHWLFLRSWLSHPLRIGAVAPSGQALAQLITQAAQGHRGPVIELGPGTGSFTRALLARGVPESRLALVETEAAFLPALRRRFPAARLLAMDAAQLGDIGCLFGTERAGLVVSGLPLMAMPLQRALSILSGVFARQLLPEGRFYQFTYGSKLAVPEAWLERLGLEAHFQGTVLGNLPPASVYCIQRRGSELPLPAAGADTGQLGPGLVG